MGPAQHDAHAPKQQGVFPCSACVKPINWPAANQVSFRLFPLANAPYQIQHLGRLPEV